MYVCRRMRLCSFLLSKGFNYVSERPDRNDARYKVWLFENSPELRLAIEEYYSSSNFHS